MNSIILFLLTFLFLIGCATNSTTTEDRSGLTDVQKAYLHFSEYRKISISPSGQLAVVATTFDNTSYIMVMDRMSNKILGGVKPGKDFSVQRFVWNGEKEVIVVATQMEGYLTGDYGSQFIFRMSVDGKDFKRLFPKKMNGSILQISRSRFGIIYDKILEGKYLFVRETSSSGTGYVTHIKKLNIRNGSLQGLEFVNLKDARVALDNKFQARLAFRLEKDLSLALFSKNLGSGQWKRVDMGMPPTRSIRVLGFTKNNDAFYFLSDGRHSTRVLYRANLSKEGKVSQLDPLFSDRRNDILSAEWDEKEYKPLYVEYGPGKPKRKYFSKSERVKLLKEMGKSFKGEIVYLGKKKGDFFLVTVRSDFRPTTYYVYNSQAGQVNEFLTQNERVRGLQLSGSSAFSFKARDGVMVDGFLWKPKNWSPLTPLIVNIHGGPFGVRDAWGYDGDVQFLLANGFSVMNVNYRGSSGRGRKFEQLGYKKLGTTMQSDIADATLWAEKMGVVKKGRTCLWGVSYGAYSAVMATHMFPEQFKCAVGFGGVYDWTSQLQSSDTQYSRIGLKFWQKFLPKSDEERLKQSPISLTQKLERPVYIMHGKEDVRCHVSQARKMKSVLEKHQKSFRYREFSGIGHWFVSDQAQKNEAFGEILSFFNENLKK